MSEDDGFVGSTRGEPQSTSLAQKLYGGDGRTVIVQRLQERVVVLCVEDVDQSVSRGWGQKAIFSGHGAVFKAQNFSVVGLDATDLLKSHHVVDSNVALSVARRHVLAIGTDSDRSNTILAVVILLIVCFWLLFSTRWIVNVDCFD